MIDTDLTEMTDLLRAFAQAPKKAQYVSAQVLNMAALGVRRGSPDTIRAEMTVRAPGLLRKGLWATLASKDDSVLAMHSVVGSLGLDRFSGWREQERGLQDPRKRVAAVAARGGTRTRQIARGARLMPGEDLKKPADYSGATDDQRAIAMLQKLSREKHKKPFIINRFSSVKRPGLYKFEGSARYKRYSNIATKRLRKVRGQNLRLLQMFDRKPASIKKRPWMSKSVAKYFNSKQWYELMEKLLLKHFFFKPER